MFDSVQAQYDLLGVLLCAPALANVNVKSYRKMRLQQELDFGSLLTQGRNGKAGAAVLVAQPTAASHTQNADGPILNWLFPVICFEQPDINFGQFGTELSAEELGQIVMDALHKFPDEKTGQFSVDGSLRPETEFVLPGVIGYRVDFQVVGKSTQTPRVGPVTVTLGGGTATLSCATAGAAIWFTTDGTFPVSDAGGGQPDTNLYSAPIATHSGMTLRAAAYLNGYNNSSVRYIVVP